MTHPIFEQAMAPFLKPSADMTQASLLARVIELSNELAEVKAQAAKDARHHDWQMQGLSKIIADRDELRTQLADVNERFDDYRRATDAYAADQAAHIQALQKALGSTDKSLMGETWQFTVARDRDVVT